jgi:sugar lactone lactonase YvrE
VQRTVATLSGNLFGQGMAFDRAGNLFVGVADGNAPPGPSTIYKFTRDGTQSTFGSFPGWIVGNLVFDSLGNLWVADAWFQLIYKFTPDGTKSVFVDSSAFEPNTGPVGLALDRFGNVFTSTQAARPTGRDTILKFTPDGVESTFATHLDWPRGLVFDRSGNLFVAQRGAFAPPGDILKFRPDGNWSVFAPELHDPQYVAFQP